VGSLFNGINNTNTGKEGTKFCKMKKKDVYKLIRG